MSLNYEPGDLDFSIPSHNAENTFAMLDGLAETRKTNADNRSQPCDASTALQAINNIFKAFNSVANLQSDQSDLPEESQDQPLINDGIEQDIACSNVNSNDQTGFPQSPSSDNTPVSILAPMNKGTQDLIESIERRISFRPPTCAEDDYKVQMIMDLKTALMSFPTLDSMLQHIIKFISDGGHTNEELLFLYINTYCLRKPWKYHDQFRRSIFSTEKFVGHGTDIEEFVQSIPRQTA